MGFKKGAGMANKYYCYYIPRSEYEENRKNNRLPYISNKPHTVIEPLQYYDAESFRALISSEGKYHTRDGITSCTYFTDYKEGKGGVFTFDGATFYKILGYHFTVDNRVEINLRRIREIYGYKANTGFMLMPFKDTFLKEFYEVHIKNFLKSEVNIDILRADDICDNDVIIDTIYSQIETAEFIIAEISEVNKNVFYELGYSAAKQKDIIMILQSGREPSFFDRSHIRRIEYSIDKPEQLKRQLADTIKSIRSKRGGI